MGSLQDYKSKYLCMSPWLSVIIPAYNCAQYIERCVMSVVTQNVGDNAEIIIINDGSQDESENICLKLKECYPQIVYVSQPNAGASTARNNGLGIARGKYVWFIDADDYILPGIMEMLYSIVNKHSPEIIAFNYVIDTLTGLKDIIIYDYRQISTIEEYLHRNKALYLWNKLYKREVIGDTRFLDGTKNIEDFLFNVEIMSKLSVIFCLPDTGYAYNICNQNSTSRLRSKRNLIKLSQDSFLIHFRMAEIISTMTEDCKWIKNLLDFSISGHLYSLCRFYNTRHLLMALDKYERAGLYPVGYTDSKKANFLIFLLNIKCFRSILRVILYTVSLMKRHLIPSSQS